MLYFVIKLKEPNELKNPILKIFFPKTPQIKNFAKIILPNFYLICYPNFMQKIWKMPRIYFW